MPEYFNDEYKGVLDSRYYIPQYAFGTTTSIQTANQLAEATSRLNVGAYGVDLALIRPELLEQVPKQHMKEINRLVKLTGAKASMHGPIIDLAGFDQQGWKEETRKETERKLSYYIDRAHDLDPDGNTPINFHINTAVPGDMIRKLTPEELDKLRDQASRADEKNRKRVQGYIDRGEINERMGVIDRESGQITAIPFEIKHFPGGDQFYTPELRVKAMNQSSWDDDKLKVFELQRQKTSVEEKMAEEAEFTAHLKYFESEEGALSDDQKHRLIESQSNMEVLKAHINELDQHIHLGLNELHHKLRHVPEKYKEASNTLMKDVGNEYNKYENDIHKIINKLKKTEDRDTQYELEQDYKMLRDRQQKALQLQLEAVGTRESLPIPDRFIPANELAREKTVETVSNAMYNNYKRYKDKTPIMTIENYWHNRTLGTASDIKDVIIKTRNNFAEKLVRTEGLDRSEADNVAKKLIGVTWDVGHINFMRSSGYGEKEILKETKTIAPYVKQIHITDNFGFEDAHLPPGMGNAPIKKQIEELKKQGFEFDKGNVIIEAGAFPQHFNENPHVYSLEHFDSPLYTMQAQPSWYNIWETQGPYSLGYGEMLPDLHHRELYGGGFSNLPPELGGQRQGSDRGRFAQSSDY